MDEIAQAERSQNRAIVLQNKVKIKYVNMENAVEYAREKYHVNSAAEFKEQWEYYLEAVEEREKFSARMMIWIISRDGWCVCSGSTVCMTRRCG